MTRLKVALWAVPLAAALAWAPLSCRRQGTAAGAAPAASAKYHCPMHPNFVSDKQGTCPICTMKLMPRESPEGGGVRKILYYRSPMDPSVHSRTAAKDSMGMDFIPVYEDESQTSESGFPGRAVVKLSAERRRVLGVRGEEVRATRLVRSIRTVGRVAVDERRLHHIHTKYEGYVEHLYVDFTGKYVKKGEPLLSIYSPELVATQEEYLLAYRARKQLGGSSIPSVAKSAVDLLDAARQRLLLWDIRPEDIELLEKEGQVRKALDFHSDISGFVVQKMAVHGMRVTPADTLFDIADLARLWVLADVYESDLPSVRVGMKAGMTVPYLPGKKWLGSVTNVAPTVEEKTRTIKVRIDVDNTGEDLKPEMFADVFLENDLGLGLVVPDNAVIDAGDRRLVFVDLGDRGLAPREVRLGQRVGTGFQVLSGLSEGERVVTAANFLIDSESSLRAALSAFSGPASASPAGHQH